jgi:hypothetical protein
VNLHKTTTTNTTNLKKKVEWRRGGGGGVGGRWGKPLCPPTEKASPPPSFAAVCAVALSPLFTQRWFSQSLTCIVFAFFLVTKSGRGNLTASPLSLPKKGCAHQRMEDGEGGVKGVGLIVGC